MTSLSLKSFSFPESELEPSEDFSSDSDTFLLPMSRPESSKLSSNSESLFFVEEVFADIIIKGVWDNFSLKSTLISDFKLFSNESFSSKDFSDSIKEVLTIVTPPTFVAAPPTSLLRKDVFLFAMLFPSVRMIKFDKELLFFKIDLGFSAGFSDWFLTKVGLTWIVEMAHEELLPLISILLILFALFSSRSELITITDEVLSRKNGGFTISGLSVSFGGEVDVDVNVDVDGDADLGRAGEILGKIVDADLLFSVKLAAFSEEFEVELDAETDCEL